MHVFRQLRLYRIKTEEYGITVLSFTGDNTHLLDIRGRGQSCRVWDPVVLYRRELSDGSNQTPSVYSSESEPAILDRSETMPSVTCVVCNETGDFFFVAKDDSTVSVYASRTGLVVAVLFHHGTSVISLHHDDTAGILTSVDTAGSLMVHRIIGTNSGWQAASEFTYETTGTGIQHFVFSGEKARVLICANDIASIYAISDSSTPLCELPCDSLGQYAWARHPSDPGSLLLISQPTTHIYSWEGLEKLTADQGVLLSGPVLSESVICGTHSLFDGSVFAIACSSSEARSNRHLFCYDSSQLSSREGNVSQLKRCEPLCGNIDHFIGTFHGKLIFLHANGWVCSVRLDGFMDSKDFAFHFMPPSDWLRASAVFVITLSRLGDVLFAWKNEVAVVKRALERAFRIDDTM